MTDVWVYEHGMRYLMPEEETPEAVVVEEKPDNTPKGVAKSLRETNLGNQRFNGRPFGK